MGGGGAGAGDLLISAISGSGEDALAGGSDVHVGRPVRKEAWLVELVYGTHSQRLCVGCGIGGFVSPVVAGGGKMMQFLLAAYSMAAFSTPLSA